ILDARATVADAIVLANRRPAAQRDFERLAQLAREQFPASFTGIGLEGAVPSPRDQFTTHLVALGSRWIATASVSDLDSLPRAVEAISYNLVRNEQNCRRRTSCDRDLLPPDVVQDYLSHFAHLRKTIINSLARDINLAVGDTNYGRLAPGKSTVVEFDSSMMAGPFQGSGTHRRCTTREWTVHYQTIGPLY
ncbi:MAG: hypothetical protein NTW72_13715, partial [Gemmatimonadetes bacterium]|nr:hypothetical protein [Gemmatimonadota bacterium]